MIIFIRKIIAQHLFMDILIWFGAILAVCAFSGIGVASEKNNPFHIGEKLNFVLKWEFIPAGKASLEVHPGKSIQGVDTYRFVMKAKSNKYLDFIYKVRDRIDAYADREMTRSMYYEQKQREGRTRREVVIRFDWETNEARYTNFGNPRDPLSISPGSFDPLSAFYYTRTLDLKVNSRIERPVSDGKKCVIGRAKVIRREKIEIPAGTFDTFLVEPELKHVGGVFEKSKNAKVKVWVTADDRKIPVKIESKVVIGRFVAELVSTEGLSRDPS